MKKYFISFYFNVFIFLFGNLGKAVEIPLDKKLDSTWKFYTVKTGHLPYGISEPFKPSYIPSILGNTIDNTSSPLIREHINGKFEEERNEKK